MNLFASSCPLPKFHRRKYFDSVSFCLAGLFQRAILISGSVLSPWALQRKPEDIATQVSIQMGCVGRLPLSHPESDLAPCLRRKHLSDLMNFVPQTPRFLSPFAPYVDNILIKNPKTIMEKDPLEQFKRSELIVVFTTSESAHELNKHELIHGFEADHKDRILRTLVRNVFNFHQQEIFSIVKNEYTDWDRPIPHPIPLRDATVEALSDCLVIAPALQVALIHGRRGAKTHLLHFSHVSREHDFSSYERLGSLEGDVVPYTMGLPVTNNVPALGGPPFLSPWSSLANFSKQDAQVSETLVHYFSNFVKSGDPNINEGVRALGVSSSSRAESSGSHDWVSLSGSTSSFAASASSTSSRERLRARPLYWDAFDGNTQLYLNLGTKPKIRSHYRGHKMALWLNLIPQIHLPGGADVTMAHHSFPDDNPELYVGPVRPLMPYTLVDQTGRGADGSAPYPGSNLQTPTISPGIAVTTTECPEGTDPPFSQGTRHTVVRGEVVDSEKGLPSNRQSNNNNANELPELGMGMSGEYDYATALTVTMTVGICLILLNVLVFAAIMCHRKRELGLPVSNHPSNREPHSGISHKSPYNEEDYKWPPSTSEFPEHLSCYGDGGGEEMGESIGLSQFPAAACAQLDLKSMSMSNCNSVMRPGRSPSPLMVLSPQKSDRSYLGSSGACGGINPSQSQKRLPVQMPMSMSIPYCVGGSANPSSSFQSNSNSPNMASSIRLYLNQSAVQGLPPSQTTPNVWTYPHHGTNLSNSSFFTLSSKTVNLQRHGWPFHLKNKPYQFQQPT
ncbi:unnamed protein product [Allacma fusca]|uniref:Carboxylesterase type B domain-containing protein n=1 Tax=Allacma fusca TaxID=39272 RepID=A0A8J2JL80_9HEXA|nr:unnamed protein product [Allacma fusca]